MVVDKLAGDGDELTNKHSRSGSSYDNYILQVGGEVGLIYGFVYDGLYSFDEFSGTDKDGYTPNDGTVDMTGIFGTDNTGDATQPGKIKFKDISGPEGYPDGKIDE